MHIDANILVRVQSGGATSSGPAAGVDGLEIILQGFNWESHRNNWYQVYTASEAFSRPDCPTVTPILVQPMILP